MDRAHRIGQTKTVNVYRLVTSDTIEEKIMDLQKSKVLVSNAIVNTENSSLYSLGTDRLLDIFTFRSEQNNTQSGTISSSLQHLKDLDDQDEEYHSLSVEEFVNGLSDRSSRC
ncbi:helicase [Fragilaria crotonensis]|nr:helicase [Fragilaria crotonensis]